MATISEDYVSFETAKLLKDKGFDTAVRHYYQKIDDDITYHIEDFRNWNVYDMWYSMPTLQMAMKWLREKYNLFIQVTIVPHTTITMEQKYYLFSIHKDRRRLRRDDIPINYFNTYEEAVETAIKYCLENLIYYGNN